MALYSFKGAYPTQLPNRTKLRDGFTKTARSTFTAEDIAEAGWIAVEDPPIADYPNKLEWNNSAWAVRPPNEAETAFRWQAVRDECEKRLFDTDYKVIKAVETGEPLDPVIAQYRQELRDLYNNVNDVDPWAVQYPVPQYSVDEENSSEPL